MTTLNRHAFTPPAEIWRDLAALAPARMRFDSGGDHPRGEVFARAAWSYLTEPGDGVAGRLVACLGAQEALVHLIDRTPVATLARRVQEVPSADADADAGAGAGGGAGGGVEGLSEADLAPALDRWRPRIRSVDVQRAVHEAVRHGFELVLPDDQDWPMGVNDLGEHAPLALWLRGRREVLGSFARSIALVGARAATGYGEHVAMEAAAGLTERGLAVVSGAAYGIDGMAHRAALASGGVTVAFLAGGADRLYPSGHASLLERIADQGAILSELPCGQAPTKWRFLQRNRLIAATTLATVVVEAGRRSGSLNTAGHAAALGRPLGAVPGPVTSPASAGCHYLIRDYDATCVTNATEMAELAGGIGFDADPDAVSESGATAARAPGAAVNGDRLSSSDRRPPEERRVLDAMSSRSGREVEEIARGAGLSVGCVLGVLGRLDLDGAVAEHDGGWVTRPVRTIRGV